MSGSSLRELGLDLVADSQWEKALGVFAEAVRRQPADHRSRMLAARCYARLSEDALRDALDRGLFSRPEYLAELRAADIDRRQLPKELR